MPQIYQGILPTGLLKELDRLDLPQRTVVALSGGDLSEPGLSSFLNGHRGLSYDVQEKIFDILRFCRELQKASCVPVNFGNVDAIKKLWDEFRAASTEEAVIRGVAELRERGDGEKEPCV